MTSLMITETQNNINFSSIEHTQDYYVEKALNELLKISRTAHGVIDTSASAEKLLQMQVETGNEAAELGIKNFKETSIYLYEQRHREFASGEEVVVFMNSVATRINNGIVKEGVLLRKADSKKSVYTKLENLESAYKQFAADFFKRLSDPQTNSIDFACYIEWRVNMTDHFFADGCGRISRALANFVLFRANQPLATTTSREEMFSYVPQKQYDPNKDDYCDDDYLKWSEYYQSLFSQTQ